MEKQQDVTSENVETEVQSENLKKGLFSRLKEKRKKKKEESLKEVEEELANEDKEKVNEKLDEVEAKANKKNSKKQKIISILLLIFNIALVIALLLWNILGDGEFTPLRSLTIYPLPFIIYLLLIALTILCDVVGAWRMIYKKTRNHINIL